MDKCTIHLAIIYACATFSYSRANHSADFVEKQPHILQTLLNLYEVPDARNELFHARPTDALNRWGRLLD